MSRLNEIEMATEAAEEGVALSRCSSVEFADEVINEKWMSVAVSRRGHLGQPKPQKQGWFTRRRQKTEHEQLLERLEQHELDELQTFIAQKLFRVDGVICDEQTRITLIEKMITAGVYPNLEHEDLVNKYGSNMADWIRDKLVPTMSDCGSVLQRAAIEFYHLKNEDPLCQWTHLPADHVLQVLKRISTFIDDMSGKVKWSLLVDPGKFSCHLTEFVMEYRRLERMFLDNELSPDESSQVAFNANYLTKARSKMVPCCDMTRVRLNDLRDRMESRRMVLSMLYEDEHMVEVEDERPYGTPDFIHASYVRGGPLENTFICTQAPLEHTQEDFWRMVYQERCEMIIMLCAAVDASSLGPLDSTQRNHCPYYWPRTEGARLRFGHLDVICLGVDATRDPLFTVTKLELRKGDGNGEEFADDNALILEHWQWNWQFLADPHWPFRVLRRARLLKTPTVVQCIDGCGKSGTLVAIEAALMHFLKGAPQTSSVVLQSCVFVRLQRRLAVTSALHYLYIYRVLLRWVEPYASTFYQRTALGLRYKTIGFINKFEAMAQELSRSSPAY